MGLLPKLMVLVIACQALTAFVARAELIAAATSSAGYEGGGYVAPVSIADRIGRPSSVPVEARWGTESIPTLLPPVDKILPCTASQDYTEPALCLPPPPTNCAPAAISMDCQECPRRDLNIFLSYDSFRGISDGNWQNNGIVVGFNFGTRLGELSEITGIGFQIGASVGAYNWSGTDYRIDRQAQAQTQGFFTFGLFRRALETSRWTAAIVADTMYNDNYGLLAQNPTMTQMRGQLGYCTSAWNEFGIWGTWRGWGDTLFVPGFGPTTWQPVQQLNVYWHHKWDLNGADTWFWVGRPEQSRLTREGSLGDYLAGASGVAPLNDRLALFALATYMHPSASPGPIGAKEDAWNFTIGLSFQPKATVRSRSVTGRCWAPLLPVANNGYFLVDTNRVY